MAKTGKTISRTARKDFSDEIPVPESLFFIGNVKYTAIAVVQFEGKAKPTTLVEFTPSQLKALMETRITVHGGSLSGLNRRGSYGIYRKPPPVAESVAEARKAVAQHASTIQKLEDKNYELERSLIHRADQLRQYEQAYAELQGDIQESRRIYQALQTENRKLKDQLDKAQGKEGRPRSSTDKQVESIDPHPYRHRLPGSHS